MTAETTQQADNSRQKAFSSASHRRRRMLKDMLARHMVSIGGVTAIVTIILIFFYLLYVVLPLFESATVQEEARYTIPLSEMGETLHLAMEEQAEIGVRFTDSGQVIFFDLQDGQVLSNHKLNLPSGVTVTSFAVADETKALVAYGLSNGQALVLKHTYRVTFPGDVRLISPVIEYPFGEEPIELDPEGEALTHLALQENEEEATLVVTTADQRLLMISYTKEASFLGEGVELEKQLIELDHPTHTVTFLRIGHEQAKLYVADDEGQLTYFNIRDKEEPELVQRLRVVEPGIDITSLKFLTGGISVIVGDSRGGLAQWFPVRDKHEGMRLQQIRSFDARQTPINAVAEEHSRKGFLAVSRDGELAIYHATAHRTILTAQVSQSELVKLAVAPRANALLAEGVDGQLNFWRIHNEHPEISWSALWGKVWYESYPEPDYIWQSSSATADFEPKYSLVPISFGTIKAAFYAMVIAMPLAILGAMYTAYFMSSGMRRVVKPSIEIMEALPTVILGFLAGLWLAPFLEQHMPGVFSLLVLMPLGIIACGFIWHSLPAIIRYRVPEGWEAGLLILPVILIGWFTIEVSPWLESALFGGDMRAWLTNEMGIGFDQRNSMVVGLAMGFAVIPTIFSIAEDAVFGVPRHLSHGSLALGATSWQTMWRVVLLTASPGIFSAVMIGFGRAVGETMIVLMATGNTPIMDFSIFQGMRTLSANIAVEMPESEVASTHFRVLFLAALVLFMFTFMFNTVAELVRQRLRKKYSSL